MAVVQVAAFADIPGWLRLAQEVEPLFGPMVDDPGFQRALRRNIERRSAFCVRQGDGPAGALLLGGLLWSAKPPVYTIGWLAVTQAARRQGIGRLLVEYVLAQVTSPAEIKVTTFGSDHPAGQTARNFYQRLGFQAAEAAPDGPEGGSRQIFRRVVT